MTTFRHSSLIAAAGRFRPIMREDVERSTRDDLRDPVFPYPHLKATLTSWESFPDAVGASNGEVVEDAREFIRYVLSTRSPRAFYLLGSRCGEAFVAHGQSSSWGPEPICSPRFGGEGPTVTPVRATSRGLGVLRTPGSGGKLLRLQQRDRLHGD